ncbi:MAG: hypothetical protein HN501_00140 [Waddliaceae bacterium]|nr:hypothetical protein [Waddliaceae bacterium]MBT6928424.1 hypothetical protein [Waddliaceae bacterium]MBT7264124.1 hypothetical protein [Waddliaceae bacterium]
MSYRQLTNVSTVTTERSSPPKIGESLKNLKTSDVFKGVSKASKLLFSISINCDAVEDFVESSLPELSSLSEKMKVISSGFRSLCFPLGALAFLDVVNNIITISSVIFDNPNKCPSEAKNTPLEDGLKFKAEAIPKKEAIKMVFDAFLETVDGSSAVAGSVYSMSAILTGRKISLIEQTVVSLLGCAGRYKKGRDISKTDSLFSEIEKVLGDDIQITEGIDHPSINGIIKALLIIENMSETDMKRAGVPKSYYKAANSLLASFYEKPENFNGIKEILKRNGSVEDGEKKFDVIKKAKELMTIATMSEKELEAKDVAPDKCRAVQEIINLFCVNSTDEECVSAHILVENTRLHLNRKRKHKTVSFIVNIIGLLVLGLKVIKPYLANDMLLKLLPATAAAAMPAIAAIIPGTIIFLGLVTSTVGVILILLKCKYLAPVSRCTRDTKKIVGCNEYIRRLVEAGKMLSIKQKREDAKEISVKQLALDSIATSRYSCIRT